MTPNAEDTDPEILDLAAYVQSSEYRIATLSILEERPTNPTNIAESQDVALSHVSRALKELREKEMVSVHGTNSRRRLYQLTDRGRKVLELAQEIGGDE